jgi:single-stranded-DNA-specific exonuclease
LVLAGHGWHAGVIGIVAGRLAEKYHRPVVLISLDELGVRPGVGSGRSAGVLNLNEAFAHCGVHLVSHGGHAAAAGLRVTEKNLAAFRTDFCEYGTDHIAVEDRVACVQIDAETSLAALTLNTVNQIERLSPFGQGNLRPTLSTTNVTLEGPPRKMGGGDRHFSAKIKQYELVLRAVAFGKGEWVDDLTQLDAPIDIAYRPVINVFRGRRSVELQLVDWRPSRVAAPVSNTVG